MHIVHKSFPREYEHKVVQSTFTFLGMYALKVVATMKDRFHQYTEDLSHILLEIVLLIH